jgi:DNA modification methylase
MSWQVLEGDALEVLRTLDAGSVQTCVTSPPYWGLRDYGTAAWEEHDPSSGWAKQRARGENTWRYTYSDQWAEENPQTGRTAEDLSSSATNGNPAGRNKRSVWEITTQPYPDAHFATFPPKLVEPCILAGSSEPTSYADTVEIPAACSTVLDPFCGSGTTGLVALRHNRSFVGIELNPTYAEMARNRIRDDAPLMNHGSEVAA